MARPPSHPIAPGLFQPKGKLTWHLRYSIDGEQVRISLGTRDYAKAVRLANDQRGRLPVGKLPKLQWNSALDAYLKKQLGNGTFTKGTVETTRFAAKYFQTWSGVTHVKEVTSKLLQDFYDIHAKARKPRSGEKRPQSLAIETIQGYTSKVATFLRDVGNPVTVKFRAPSSPKRDVVVPKSKIAELIENCPRGDLKFVLYAGFHAGMRKEEICMATPSWFQLDLGRIQIPECQTVNGRTWRPKSKRGRLIPLSEPFKYFLEKEFGDWMHQPFMLHPQASGERYRWDFRRPFVEYVKAQGLWKTRGINNVSPHTMRHTFITHLADSGFSATQISAWSGDRIKTLETNYLHTSAPKGAIDDLYSQEEKVSPEAALKVIQEQLGKIEPELIGKVESLLKQHPKSPDIWEWTNKAPPIHAKMYSVQDTIASRSVFHAILDLGDGFVEDGISDEDWEDGIYSTEKARLHTLQAHGLIQKAKI